MEVSAAQVVNRASMFQQANARVEGQVNVFKKNLDIQADNISQLINSVPQQPELAKSGSVGTKLNVVA